MKTKLLPKKPVVQTKKNKAKLNSDPFKTVNSEYFKIFSSLDVDENGFVSIEDIFKHVKNSGIAKNDKRISCAVNALHNFPDYQIDFAQFKTTISQSSALFKSIFQKQLVIPDFETFCSDITSIFEEVKSNEKGEVASYIPQLARVDPSYFATAITTVSGQRFQIGDSKKPFCLQSVIKPINYCLALDEHGTDIVHNHIGREPSGHGFNELSLNKEGLPHNPMINAGAIMCCSLIRPKLNLADRFDYISNAWKRLSGNSHLNFNNTVYLSEKESADRNFALGYFMREKNSFPENTNLTQTLEFYFQCCSIELDTEALSIVAASLANGGICPTTGEKIFNPETVQHCLSLMGSCGMYDYSGEFAFTIGLPSKSGVSGSMMIVIPNLLGIAIWSPRLDSLGNSVRGIEFCKKLIQQYSFHLYDNVHLGSNGKKDPRLKKNYSLIEKVVQLCWAASQGDLMGVQNLIANDVDPNEADYDGRTALHLAAAEGHLHIVKYLISKKANILAIDRWKGTPLSDAKKNNRASIVKYFEQRLKI